MTTREREVIDKAVERLSLLLEQADFPGTVELADQLEQIRDDLNVLLN